MSTTLTSPFLQLVINSDKATWSLHGRQHDSPCIEDAWMQVDYRTSLSALLRSGKRRHQALQEWPNPTLFGPVESDSSHGKLQQLTIRTGPDENGLFYRIEFALPEKHPFFMWRLQIDNHSPYPVEIDRLTLMQAGFFPKLRLLPNPGPLSARFRAKPVGYGAIRPHPDPGDLAFFSNGWQSWSFTGTLGTDQRQPGTRLGFFGTPLWYNPETPQPKKRGHFASDMFGLLGDRQHRTGILVGFLSQKQHFGSLEAFTDPIYPALALWANGDQVLLNPGTQMTTDWAAIQFVEIDAPEPQDAYLEAVGRENQISPPALLIPPSVGWCSWYQYFQDISAEEMRLNLQAAQGMKSTLPIGLFQIDDGFEAQIGDWLDFSPQFPMGVAPLAKEIQQAGFTPGLWLAPFIVHAKSRLKQVHPDWLLRNRVGRPVNAGFIWNHFNTALDLTHPEALAYAHEVVHTAVHQWGYPFLKLDFLYAAAIDGRYRDRTKTRAQVLRLGLETLRAAAGPEVHLLGCGVPLGPSIGLFDSMRVGADVDPGWFPSIKRLGPFLRNEYSLPSTRNAIQNALTRASLHRRWWINDADCLLVRPDNQLTLAEVQSLATVIALTGGPLLLSDDLTKLPADRLRLAEQLVPLIGQRGRLLDWFDATTPQLLRLDLENQTGKWHLLAVFNWQEEEQDIILPLAKFALPRKAYFGREFWSGETNLVSGESLTLKGIPAHGVKLLALRPAQRERACYLGSDLHISQGLEVISWSGTPTSLRLGLDRPGNSWGQIDLALPRPPSQVNLNKNEIPWRVLEDGLFCFPVEFNRNADLFITW